MHSKTYLAHTWVDPRVIVKKSSIDGNGLFAKTLIKQGEIVMIWGGIKIPIEEYVENKYRDMTLVPIDEETYLGLPITDNTESIDEYLNHSCDPSVWLVDEVTLVARRDIHTGQEITVDAATWDADEDWLYVENGKCHCGTSLCRKTITPHDWTLKELQQRYKGHFSPYLEKRVRDSQID